MGITSVCEHTWKAMTIFTIETYSMSYKQRMELHFCGEFFLALSSCAILLKWIALNGMYMTKLNPSNFLLHNPGWNIKQ